MAGFLSKISLSIIGQVVYMLGQLGVLSTLSHFAGLEAVGKFGLALAITTPIFVLANMGLRSIQAADQDDEFGFRKFLFVRLITSSCALSLCILGTLVTPYEEDIKLIITVFAVAKFFECFSELSYGTFEKRGLIKYVFVSLFLRSALMLLGFIALIYAGAPIWVAVGAQAICWAVIALFLDLPRIRKTESLDSIMPEYPGKQGLKRIFARAAPLGGTNFLQGGQLNIIRVYVEARWGLVAAGVFTNLSYCFQGGGMIGNAMKHVFVPVFSKKLRSKEDGKLRKQFLMLLLGLSILCLFGLLAAVLVGEPIIQLLFGAETASYNDVFLLICVAIGLRIVASIPHSLIVGLGKVSSQFVRELLLFIFAVFAGWLIVDRFDLVGASAALIGLVAIRVSFDLIAIYRSGRLTRPQSAPSDPTSS